MFDAYVTVGTILGTCKSERSHQPTNVGVKKTTLWLKQPDPCYIFKLLQQIL